MNLCLRIQYAYLRFEPVDIIDDEEEELEDTKMDVDVIDTSIRVQESAALPEKRSGIGTKSLASNAAVNILQPRKKQK